MASCLRHCWLPFFPHLGSRLSTSRKLSHRSPLKVSKRRPKKRLERLPFGQGWGRRVSDGASDAGSDHCSDARGPAHLSSWIEKTAFPASLFRLPGSPGERQLTSSTGATGTALPGVEVGSVTAASLAGSVVAGMAPEERTERALSVNRQLKRVF